MKVQPRDIVVLKKDPQRKKLHRFFYTTATVIECPPQGTWLKVQLNGASPIAWRKAYVIATKGRLDPSTVLKEKTMMHIFSFFTGINNAETSMITKRQIRNLVVLSSVSPSWKQIAMTGRKDPSTILGEDLMVHIFSFLGGKQEQAIRLDAQLMSTGKKWQQIYIKNTVGIMGRLCVNLDIGLENYAFQVDRNNPDDLERQVREARRATRPTSQYIHWMCKRKLPLQEIVYHPPGPGYYGHDDQPRYNGQDNQYSLQSILEKCDTSQLKKATVGVKGSNRWAYRDQRSMYEAVARECPRLESLTLSVWLPRRNHMETLSMISRSPLFSMPSIEQLHLELTTPRERPWTRADVDNLTCRLGGLTAPASFECKLT